MRLLAGLLALALLVPAALAAPVESYRVVRTYPHDSNAFTQGLVFAGGHLYESTGRNGQSSLRMVNLETGRVEQQVPVATQYFAEGLTARGGTLIQLTWQSHVAFVYDLFSFRLLRTLSYPWEGWGLTQDGKSLILSDGSSTLRFLDPKTMKQRRRITVNDDGKPVTYLNELEYIRGEIYANVWHTDRIARIAPATGKVLAWIDLSGLLPGGERSSPEAVLNGIAWDPVSDRLFVTGKLWPKLFEIKAASARQAKATLHPLAFYTIDVTSPRGRQGLTRMWKHAMIAFRMKRPLDHFPSGLHATFVKDFERRWCIRLALLAFLFAPPLRAQGPPYQTDDPVPVDFRHYEFYIFGSADGTPVEMDSVGPAFEFNWGAIPRVQIHAILPWGVAAPLNNPIYAPAGTGPTQFGLTDMELGVKIAYIKESKYIPQIGTFTMFEMPTGNSDKGLGVGKVWYKLPLWLQKNFGKWLLDGGAGEALVPQTGYHDFPYGGFLVKRELSERLELGAEVFSHGGEGVAPPQMRASTMIDLGGYYHFKHNPNQQFLFCYGHSVAGQTENYAYAGMYWTWGKDDSKPDSDKALLWRAPNLNGH